MPDRPSFPPPKRGRPTREQREWASRKRPGQQPKPRRASGYCGWLGVLAVVVFAAISAWPEMMSVGGRSVLADEAGTPSDTFSCQVSSVQDGDTLACGDGTRVRLHAVAAREKNETCSPGHPCPEASAASATAKLRELTLGQTIACEKTGTSYERVTAICSNEAAVEINCAMVESGTTVVWPKYNEQRAICG